MEKINITRHLGYGPSAVYQIGAAVAANSGPRVVGISFTRKNRIMKPVTMKL